jgi:RNA polymerase sigma factor (sigma-70 family)
MLSTTASEDPSMTNAPPDPHVPAPSSIADFDELYHAEWHGLVALAWSLSGSWPAAEDLVQDAFADAYRRWEHVGALDRPGAWVRRAIINRVASGRRRRSVETRGLARAGGLQLVAVEGASTDRTGERAVANVADPAFWSAVRMLPDRQRACVVLHYLEDRSVAEIAEILDCRPATVKVHLHRGRQTLASRLAALAPTDLPESTHDRTPDDRTTAARREEQR